MSRCDQEHWTGEGCVCAVFGIERSELEISGLTQEELHGPLEPPHYNTCHHTQSEGCREHGDF